MNKKNAIRIISALFAIMLVVADMSTLIYADTISENDISSEDEVSFGEEQEYEAEKLIVDENDIDSTILYPEMEIVSHGLGNPIHHCNNGDESIDDYGEWSTLYFGSYPQKQITDTEIIAQIDAQMGNSTGDVWIGNHKYRKINKDYCNDSDNYGNVIYRYFEWEPIKWRVLHIEGDRALIVTDKILYSDEFNEKFAKVTWGTSSIRNHLNGTASIYTQKFPKAEGNFLNSAFLNDEQSAIESTSLNNSATSYPDYIAQQGSDTVDKIFLLSYTDIVCEDYGFCNSVDCKSISRRAFVTEYAWYTGCYNSNYGGDWWTRSTGDLQYSTTYVPSMGYIGLQGYGVIGGTKGVRPALYLNLSNSSVWSLENVGIRKKCGNPQFSVASGTYADEQKVKLFTNDSDAKIYYTIDGTEPSETNGTLYKNPIVVGDSISIKAIATKNGFESSEVVKADYEIKPCMDPTEFQIGSIKLGDAFSGNVDNADVEEFYPTCLKLDEGIIPIGVSVEYGNDGSQKYNVVIGIISEEESFEDYAKKIDGVVSLCSATDNIKTKKLPIFQIMDETEIEGSFIPEIEVAGYYEKIFDKNGNIVSQSGKVLCSSTWNASICRQFLTNIGPIYFSLNGSVVVEGNFQLKYEGGINDLLDDTKWNKEGTLKMSPILRPAVGYGLNKVAALEIYGEGKAETQLIPWSKCDFSVTLGVRAYILSVFEFKKEVVPASFTLWDTTSNMNSESVVSTAKKTDLKLVDSSYVNRTTEWNGDVQNNKGIQLEEEMNEHVLQRSVLPSSLPEMVEFDGKKVMIYQSTDSEVDYINSTRMLYTVFENGEWSEPQAVYDNGTLDTFGSLKVIDDDLYLVWQKENKVIDEKMSINEALSELAKGSEIYLSKFNSINNRFEEVVRITNDNYTDICPEVAKDTDGITCVWIRNKEGDLSQETGENEIVCKKISDGNVDSEKVIYSTTESIDTIKVCNTDGCIFIGAVINDGTCANAIVINSEGTVVHEGSCEENGSVATMISGTDYIAYYANGVFYQYDVADATCQKYVAGNSIIGGYPKLYSNSSKDAILWIDSKDNKNVVYASIKEADVFGEPVVIYETPNKINYLSAILNNDNSWELLMNQRENDVNIVYAHKDECQKTKLLGADISEINDNNNTITLNYFIENVGDGSVDDLALVMKNDNGEVIYSKNISKHIPSGQILNDKLIIPISEITGYDLLQHNVNVDIEVKGQGYDEESAKSVSVRQTDLSLDVVSTYDGEVINYFANIQNNSNEDAGDVVLHFYADAEKTHEIKNVDIGVVSSLQTRNISTVINYDELKGCEQNEAFYLFLDVTSNLPDRNEIDNEDYSIIYIEADQNSDDPDKPNNPSKESYKIVYNLYGGTNDLNNPDTFTEDDLDIVLKDALKDGFLFGGWYEDEYFDNPITTIEPTQKRDYVVYAKWIQKEITDIEKPDAPDSGDDNNSENNTGNNNTNNNTGNNDANNNTGNNTNNSNTNNNAGNDNTNNNTEKDPTETAKVQINAFVKRMYTVALGREAEGAGLEDWSGRLSNQKIDGAGIAQGFICSAEFTNRKLNNSDYVDVLYHTFFDREPDEGGKNYWLSQLNKGVSRTEVLAGFVNSNEFANLCDSFHIARGTMQADGSSIYRAGVRSYVLRMYTKALNRDGETVGVEDWTNRINTKAMSAEAVAKSFFNSEEFINRNLSNEDYVETLYQTFMDRASDPTGKADWVNKLNSGVSRKTVLEGFSRSTEFNNIMKSFGL